jgi:hypothetical protein
MDFSQHGNYVNPADLFATYDAYNGEDSTAKSELDLFSDPTFASTNINDFPGSNDLTTSHQDSAIDLRGYYTAGYAQVKIEDSAEYDFFQTTQYSTPTSNTSNTSNTTSPHGDMIFSNANSPGDYTRDQSHTSSPEASSDMAAKDGWVFPSSADDGILIPQSIDSPRVTILVDKAKTRAETQIKTILILDPLPHHFLWARFPRRTLSKSKQLASTEDIAQNEEGNLTVRIETTLVCASAVDTPEKSERALRRARGEEPLPTRQRGTQVSEIEKEDPAHPQNGGAVVICEGCKERERKRYDRKKKRNQEEENEWTNYEDDRIIMINEKEFKRWQDVEPDQQHGPEAKRVEFAMRITCYCRHQEEKTPLGYKVVFTFRDSHNVVLAQKMSEIIQITDDHKNREHNNAESLTSELTILTPSRLENMPAQYAVPLYNTYASPTGYAMYSQPTTPVLPQFQSPMSPMDPHYPLGAQSVIGPHAPQPAFAYGGGTIAAPTPAPSYANHQRYQSYSNTPMLSPTELFSAQTGFPLHRPQSLDSFSAAFAGMYTQPNPYSQPFASQPPSRNVSRPASPTWEQGPSHRTKKMRAATGFYMAEDPDHE